MNLVDQPSADYAHVVVNGSWNGWNGWGVELADADGDGIFTGTLAIAPGTQFEYVVAVTGQADGWSGWGMQWGDGCAGANVVVIAGDAGTTTNTTLVAGCAEILGCMDANASNYNADATAQAYDQYGNAECIYASCDDIPDEEGCIYANAYAPYGPGFGPAECTTYGGTACTSVVIGCMDANATNYDPAAEEQAYDQYGNLSCIYASCDDIPAPGCIYADGFGYFNPEFGEDLCIQYGGTACPPCDDVDADGICDDIDDCVGAYDDCGVCNGDNSSCSGCMDETACDYDASATIQAVEAAESMGLAFSWSSVGNYPGEISWSFEGVDYAAGDEFTLDLAAGTYTVSGTDSWGDGWNGGELLITDVASGNVTSLVVSGSAGSVDVEVTGGVVLCDYTSCLGCTDAAACNYDETATQDDGTCYFAGLLDCEGNCADGGVYYQFDITDQWNDGMCCAYGEGSYTILVGGEVVATGGDFGSGAYHEFCAPADVCVQLVMVADNYPSEQSWTMTADGVEVGSGNGSDATYNYGNCVGGCMDDTACNYSADANYDDASCEYAAEFYNCSGDCINDTDGDGVCDELEVYGCVIPTACNYAEGVTELVPCVFPDPGYDCNGVCIGDADGDGVCDLNEIPGCTDAGACNYSATATDDDGSCDFASCLGCTDATACNYDPTATQNDGSCDFCSCGNITGEQDGFGLELVEMSDNGFHKTYRVYVTTPNTDDFVSSVSGTSDNPSYLRTSTSFYQNSLGGLTADMVNPLFFPMFPDLAFDSWLTIGIDQNPGAGEGFISTAIAAGDTWADDFEAGGNLELNSFFGGSWFSLNNVSNGVAGDDQKVLVAQLSTDGNITGSLYVQVFPGGDSSQEILLSLSFGNGTCGCTDETACNYDPEATNDDGSCTVVDECGVCGGLGAVYACGCDPIPEGDCDCDGSQFDALGECGGDCTADADEDGICDDIDDCVGVLDECGVCNGPGAIYECGCNDIPEGECDCDGSHLDAIGVCGGDCSADVNGNGLCDDSETVGCTDAEACNYNADATLADDSCEYPEMGYDCAGNCIIAAIVDAGDSFPAEINGYYLPVDGGFAQDYEGGFEIVDNGCGWELGRMEADPAMVDAYYNALYNFMTFDEFMATYGAWVVYYNYYTGDCANVSDVDMSPESLNSTGADFFSMYNSCCPADLDADGICDTEDDCVGLYDDCGVCNGDNSSCSGCMDESACDYDASATVQAMGGADAIGLGFAWSSVGSYPGEITWSFDGVDYGAGDEFTVELAPGTYTVSGTDSWGDGWNGGELVITDLATGNTSSLVVSGSAGSIEVVVSGGVPLCDYESCLGCMDATACNYDETATQDDASCYYETALLGCDGMCLDGGVYYQFDITDQWGDGMCCSYGEGSYSITVDGVEVAGGSDFGASASHEFCAPADACVLVTMVADNYPGEQDWTLSADGVELASGDGTTAVHEFGSCYTACGDDTACNYEEVDINDADACEYADAGYDCDGVCLADADGDGVCDEFEVAGCMEAGACNYDEAATDEDGSCYYADAGYDCSGVCLADADGDGVCDEFEVGGCDDFAACNYNADATDNDGSCDYLSCAGCTDAGACNYDATAVIEDGSCWFANPNEDCDGNCLNDNNNNGICDEAEVLGCMYADADNYNPEANIEDGSCDFSTLTSGCTDSAAINYYAGATDDDGSCMYIGCMDEEALNFDSSANINCGCEYPDACPGDLNGDLEVDVSDLLDFFQLWGNVCE